jgi:TolB protein
MPVKPTIRAILAITALLALAAPAARADTATFAGASDDGERAFFTTTEQLVPGDTDTRLDIYERSYDDSFERYVTRHVSTGPTGGNDAFPSSFNGAAADGSRVFFTTLESLVSVDTDHSRDVYVRDLEQSTTALVSRGSSSCAAAGCGNGEVDSNFSPRGVIPDGTRVFFLSEERLAAGDEDSAQDVYMRDLVAETTVLVSAGAAGCGGCGNGNLPAIFRGASASGEKAFLITTEALAAEDGDALLDVYERDLGDGTTTLVSEEGACPSGLDCSAVYWGTSEDGSHVYFETNERLGTDADSFQDVYDWAGGTPTLVSTGPADAGAGASTFAAASADGARIFFSTSQALVAGDKDAEPDVYERAGGATALVSTGPAGGDGEFPATLRWVSPDGSTAAVLFSTAEQLVAEDKDEAHDVYRRAGGTTTLVSTGPAGGNGNFNASLSGASNDGSRVFLTTEEQLTGQDTDAATDVYEVAAGTTTLVSTGPVAKASIPASVPGGGVSDDGAHVFFATEERLTIDDLDAEADVYDRSAAGTLLVSIGNAAPLGPPTPSQLATNPASPGISLTPGVTGQSDLETAIKIYATSDCSGAPVATGTSVELGGSGIPVSVGAGTTTTFRATATDTNGETSPCSAPVSYTHQSASPPPPPPPAPETGSGGGTTGGGTTAPPPTGGGGESGGGSKKGGEAIAFVTPHTRITYGPAAKTRVRRPVFRFADSTGQPGTAFRCKVDRGRWFGCGSPVKLKRLGLGRHVFQVRARNARGEWEPAPVKRAFKVVGG